MWQQRILRVKTRTKGAHCIFPPNSGVPCIVSASSYISAATFISIINRNAFAQNEGEQKSPGLLEG